MSKKKSEEIRVDAPALSPKKEQLLEDTTGVEALDIFKAFAKISKRLSILMISAGVLFSTLSIIISFSSSQIFFSHPLFISFLGFLGTLNMFFGLILLMKE